MTKLSLTVNGRRVTADIDPRTLLVDFLRHNQRLTGTHVGCDTSQCGACTVHLDGRSVKSCAVLAASCNTLQPLCHFLAGDRDDHALHRALRLQR